MVEEDKDAASRLLDRHGRHHRSLKQRDERREISWSRQADLHRASRMTEEIRSEPGEADKLNRARQHARERNLISQEELDRELDAGDE